MEMRTPNNLMDELFAMRNEFRERNRTGLKVVKGRDLPWECNAQGKIKWYVHPRKTDTCSKSFVLYVQEIPPGSRTVKQRHPGGVAHVVLSGRMVAVVDGKRYECETGDCIALPIKHRGVEYQFFNPSWEWIWARSSSSWKKRLRKTRGIPHEDSEIRRVLKSRAGLDASDAGIPEWLARGRFWNRNPDDGH